MAPSGLHDRPPPPPPPSAVPPSRQSTGRESLIARGGAVDDHESEYEGDYDTDIAPTASHKDALKARPGREPSLDDESALSEGTSAESPVPAARLPPVATTRAPPPLPSHGPPSRKSTDAPRGPPPVPPPHQEDDDYDPYRYDTPPSLSANSQKAKITSEPFQESDPDFYAASPREAQRAPPPVPPTSPPSHKYDTAPPQLPEHRDLPPTPQIERGSAEMSRRSMDPGRQPTTSRRSMDPASRPSGDGSGHIARDVDLAETSIWWAQPDTPPPGLQNRSDILYEMEESLSSKRGGRSTTSKDIYILFQDYSQTIITARYDTKDPTHDVQLEQRHEPPPSKMRQDQLEAAHNKFGASIATAAMTKQNQTSGDGTPRALVLELLNSAAPGALQPVGTRAYGALVYCNMANASVSQFDEIRPGDIVTFRNAKFKGKHGAMHAKYSMDVGKPEHVAVVIEWDGTKKKIHALEQGREKERKKAKVEGFRVEDLGACDVKVSWVVGREWGGWVGNA